jgi:hypothetical protein
MVTSINLITTTITTATTSISTKIIIISSIKTINIKKE